MATVSIASLGLGNADLTVIGKLSETGLSQTEVADAVVEGDKLKKGNKIVAYDGHLTSTSNPHSTTANQVGAYTKAEVDALVAGGTDLSDYYNKAQVDSLISAIPETDLSNYYNKTEVYNKLESYSKAEVDSLIAGGGADLSDYYTKAQVDSLIDAIPETDLTNYYNKTEVYNKLESYSKVEVDNLIPDINTKQDTLVSATNIKTINGESILGSGDLVISGGGSGGSGGGYFTGTAGITVGGITTGDTFKDVPVTDMINNLINPELTPNLTNPNNVLTSTVSGLREIGTSITPRLTATFNRGSISPQYSASGPYRAGLPTKYVFTSTAGLNQEVETDATTYGIDVSSFEVALGTVTFSSNISYSAGPQPTTSKGNVFDNPLPAGTTGNKTVTITGVYPCYNGISTLTKMTLANHGGTITVDAPADMNVGGERFKIQYPTVWSAKTPVVQQENELSKAWDNQNMSDYSITTIDKNGVSYKQVVYIGAGIGARKLRLVF